MTDAPVAVPDLTGLRPALRRNGYRPVPVAGAHLAFKSAGKRPLLTGWATICARADEAEIRRWTKDQAGCTNRTDGPMRLAETYLAREGNWRLRVLTGLINSPTLREDGSILDQPGHDAQTGLLFDPQGQRFPALPRDPDRDTALRALGYVAAALTILRAHHVAGSPAQGTSLGSFADWSRRVRDALIWLGEADPCETMDGMRSADPKLGVLITVIEQWHEVIGGDRVPVRQIFDCAIDQRPPMHGRPEFLHPEFREALVAIAGEGGAISGGRLGKWIGANQNRNAAGLKLISAGLSAGRARWQLVAANRDAAIDKG